MRVAQIGLGAIGTIYATRLAAANVDLTVFDKSRERISAAESIEGPWLTLGSRSKARS